MQLNNILEKFITKGDVTQEEYEVLIKYSKSYFGKLTNKYNYGLYLPTEEVESLIHLCVVKFTNGFDPAKNCKPITLYTKILQYEFMRLNQKFRKYREKQMLVDDIQ